MHLKVKFHFRVWGAKGGGVWLSPLCRKFSSFSLEMAFSVAFFLRNARSETHKLSVVF